MAGGKAGFVISVRPHRYPNLPQQNRLKEAAKACGIEKGISRAALVDKMKNCLPQWYRNNSLKSESERKEGQV
jgi:hypothetical protein